MSDANNSASANRKRFSFTVSDRAKAEAKQAADWLRDLPFGGDALALRFSETLLRVMQELCDDLAERFASGSNLPRPDEEASVTFARPTYRHTFTTAAGGKRKRGQTAGVYVLFYDLTSAVDTVTIITLRHGAAEPLTAWINQPSTSDN